MKIAKVILIAIILALFFYMGTLQSNTVYVSIEKIVPIYVPKERIVFILVYKAEPLIYQVTTEPLIYQVTAYTAGPESTGKTQDHPEYGITASGAKVRPGHTIACPVSLPFGTKIFIPHFNKEFVCEDRGSAITEGKLDVYIEDLQEALKFGRRDLEIMIIKEDKQ